MITPKTPLQSVALLVSGFLSTIVLVFLMSLYTEMDDDVIVWKEVFKDCLQVTIALLPPLLLSIGVPIIGTEKINNLVNHIGRDKATEVLSDAHSGNLDSGVLSKDTDLDKLADKMLDKIEERDRLRSTNALK